MTLQEWFSTVDNITGIIMAGMMIIQVLFIGATFWFGSRYLEQHKEKVLLEKKLVIIYDTISLLTDFIEAYNESVTISSDKLREILNEQPRPVEKLKLLVLERERKINLSESKLSHLRKKMEVNILLINSSKLDISWKGMSYNINKIEERYKNYENRFHLFPGTRTYFGNPTSINSEALFQHFLTLSHKIFGSNVTESRIIVNLYNKMLNDLRQIYFEIKI